MTLERVIDSHNIFIIHLSYYPTHQSHSSFQSYIRAKVLYPACSTISLTSFPSLM